jgi:hypothetical protein
MLGGKNCNDKSLLITIIIVYAVIIVLRSNNCFYAVIIAMIIVLRSNNCLIVTIIV